MVYLVDPNPVPQLTPQSSHEQTSPNFCFPGEQHSWVATLQRGIAQSHAVWQQVDRSQEGRLTIDKQFLFLLKIALFAGGMGVDNTQQRAGITPWDGNSQWENRVEVKLNIDSSIFSSFQ